MKTTRKRLVTALAPLLVIGALGLGIDAVAQDGAMAKQMEMMKQMMMNRPKSMKKADQAIQT